LLSDTQPLQLQDRCGSIKGSLQTQHLLHGLQSSVTDSSCSFLTFGNIVTSISSCFACPLCLNNWHSLPPNIHLQPAFCSVLSQYVAVSVQCWILAYKTIFV